MFFSKNKRRYHANTNGALSLSLTNPQSNLDTKITHFSSPSLYTFEFFLRMPFAPFAVGTIYCPFNVRSASDQYPKTFILYHLTMLMCNWYPILAIVILENFKIVTNYLGANNTYTLKLAAI